MTPLLDLLRTAPAETPLSDMPPPFDLYGLALELDDAGTPAPWGKVLAWQTCGDVADWCVA